MSDRIDNGVVSGVRTAIGAFGGSLSALRPDELATIVIREAITRARVAPSQVENVVIGTVIPTQPRDAYVSRVAAVNSGVSIEAPAMNVNRLCDRLCGSGLQAIISAAQAMALGEHDIAVAGGAESMSNTPHMVLAARHGQKTGNVEMFDTMLGALHDPFEKIHMGVTAENVAELYGISRDEQDILAVESHRRAAAAISAGYFKAQIIPISIKTRKDVTMFDTDEHVRFDATFEGMARLRPVFKKDGTVTAGNASGINDGAAAVLLVNGTAVIKRGLQPIAKILSWGHGGVEPSLMGLGPVKAVPVALQRAGLTLDQMDVIESNEAFAAQACGVAKELGLDRAKTNPHGTGISLSHPTGATGAILTIKAAYELKRIGGQYGMITMCIGGARYRDGDRSRPLELSCER